VQVVLGSSCTLLVNYTQPQLTNLLQILKDREVSTCSLVEDERDLLLLKQTDVGVAVVSTNQPYLDRDRYCDVKIASLRHFLKLLFLHARVPFTSKVEQSPSYL